MGRANLVALALLLAPLAGCTPAPEIAFDGDTVQARGWTGDAPAGGWAEALVVYAGDPASTPPMLGDYRRTGSRLTFTPRFEPAPGVTLHIVYRPPGKPELRRDIAIPAEQVAPSTVVQVVYPTTETVPANTLKFYAQFSAPMSRGQAWENIRLLDETGAQVEDAFIDYQELWDPQATRLTLLFNPGRIKREVEPNRSMGAPLAEGHRYTLVISPAWQDARGAPLKAEFRKIFTAGPAVRTPVTPLDWKIAPPRAGTRDPLVLTFPRPLDAALLQHAITVQRNGAPVAGAVSLSAQETRWSFTPSKPWRAGEHRFLVDEWLEDLAANRIGRVFDVDRNAPAPAAAPRSVAFVVR